MGSLCRSYLSGGNALSESWALASSNCSEWLSLERIRLALGVRTFPCLFIAFRCSLLSKLSAVASILADNSIFIVHLTDPRKRPFNVIVIVINRFRQKAL